MAYDDYRQAIIERIMSNSVDTGEGCLFYGGGKLKHKYGLISITLHGKRKSVPAHRAIYMATHDMMDIPTSTCVRHKCDNPACVNINHLEAGTAKDNIKDCIERNRRAKKYKPHARVRTHSDSKIREIRKAQGKLKDIADAFNVSISYVSRVRAGKAKALVK